jgi:hypothetical protein
LLAHAVVELDALAAVVEGAAINTRDGVIDAVPAIEGNG